MNADTFSMKARRTTRIPLRVPVIVVFQEQGKTRSMDAWTMIVNVHGARLECKRASAVGEEVLIQVPFSGKAEKGKVVWRSPGVNKNGNYELAVELDKPENLWGVGFPPSDWQSKGATADLMPAGPGAVEPTTVDAPPSNLPAEQNPAPVAAENGTAAPMSEPTPPLQPAVWPADVPAPHELPPAICESPLPAANLMPEPAVGPLAAAGLPASTGPLGSVASELPVAEAGISLNLSKPGPQKPAPEQGIPAFAPVGLILAEQQAAPLGNTLAAAPVSPSAGSLAGKVNATDRLSAIFDELVESALHVRLSALVERLGVRIETRIAEIENAALTRVEERIQGAALSHSGSLEKRALETVARQQELLEQSVRKFLQDAEANARSRQEAFLEEKLPRLLSEHMEEAGQLLKQRMETMAAESTARFSTSLEAQAEQFRVQACTRLEQQMEQAQNQAGQSFLRQIVNELNSKQQTSMQHAQRSLEDLVEQRLCRARQSLSQMLKEIGEALIRQAYQQGDVPAEVSPVCAEPNHAPAAEPLLQADGPATS